MKKIFGEEHANASQQVSITTWELFIKRLGQYNEAKEFYEKALIIQEKDFRRGTCRCSSKLITIWEVFIKNLDSTMRQKNTYEKALIIRKKIFGEEHANVASKL